MSHFGIVVVDVEMQARLHLLQKASFMVSKSLKTKKTFIVMIQMHDEKTMLKKLNACKVTNHESFMIHSTLTHGLHFLFLIGLAEFEISIVGIPCEFKKFCITNLIHPNCYGKIIILFYL
jgi:hypothetical protein